VTVTFALHHLSQRIDMPFERRYPPSELFMVVMACLLGLTACDPATSSQSTTRATLL
jgi:hypothetical protein